MALPPYMGFCSINPMDLRALMLFQAIVELAIRMHMIHDVVQPTSLRMLRCPKLS